MVTKRIARVLRKEKISTRCDRTALPTAEHIIQKPQMAARASRSGLKLTYPLLRDGRSLGEGGGARLAALEALVAESWVGYDEPVVLFKTASGAKHF